MIANQFLGALRRQPLRRQRPDQQPLLELPSYVVCDLPLRVPQGRWFWSAVAANLFDEVYSTIGYSATYYPMPGRSFYLEARYRF